MVVRFGQDVLMEIDFVDLTLDMIVIFLTISSGIIIIRKIRLIKKFLSVYVHAKIIFA